MLDRFSRPESIQLSEISLKKVQTDLLKNGIPLHVLSLGNTPVVKLEIAFPYAGGLHEKKSPEAFLALKILQQGSKKYNGAFIAEKLASCGAFIETQPSFDYNTISLYCLNRHLPELLPIFVSIITEPVFPEKNLTQLKTLQLRQLEIQQQKNNIQASKMLRKALYGSHPYGQIITKEDIESIESQDLASFFDSNMRSIEVFASGLVDEPIINLIKKSFNGLGKSFARSIESPELKNISASEKILVQESSTQSSIKIGKRIIGKENPDYYKLLMTNHIVGGYFGSRLMKKLREDLASTYSIGSGLVSLNKDSYLVISTDVKKDIQQNSKDIILDELQKLIDSGLEENELNLAKNHLIGSFQSSLISPFSLIEKFKSIHFSKLDYGYYDQYFSSISDIKPQDIINTATRYLQPQSFSTVIIG